MKKVIISSITVLILILSFLFDKELISFIANNRLELLNPIFIILSIDYFLAIILALLTLFLLYKEKNKVIPFVSSIIVTYLVIAILKILIARVRPDVITLIETTTYSMPSRHAALAFMPLAFIQNKKFRIIYIILAILISFSRLYNGLHFLSDLIIGSLIGYFIGLFFYKLEEKYQISKN